MDLAAHRGRHRQRRHAVSRRFGDRGDQPAEFFDPSGRPPDRGGRAGPGGAAQEALRERRRNRRREGRIGDAFRDHRAASARFPRTAAPRAASGPRRCPRRGRGFRRHAGAARRRRRGPRKRPGASLPAGNRRGGGVSPLARRQHFHLHRLPRIRLRQAGRIDPAEAGPGRPGSGSCATRRAAC